MDLRKREADLATAACARLDKLLATEAGMVYGAAFFGSYREAEGAICGRSGA